MPDLTISIIQPDLKWEVKIANLRNFDEKIASINGKTEVVILPEMFSTGFSMNAEKLAEAMDGETIAWMKEVAKNKKFILTGSVIIKEDGKFFNRLIWMLPTGEFGHYDKRHLFAYAKEHEHFTPGNKRLVASVKGWKINLQVCYDLRFPIWARQQSNEESCEYDVLIYVANWPERRIAAWKTLLRARAIENQCYVIGVNRVGKDANEIEYSGDSMIIDPLGEIIFNADDSEQVYSCTLQKEKLIEVRNQYPFWKDADHFLIPE